MTLRPAAHQRRVAARVVQQRQPQRHQQQPAQRGAAGGQHQAFPDGGAVSPRAPFHQPGPGQRGGQRRPGRPAARSWVQTRAPACATLAAGWFGTPVCIAIQMTQMMIAQPREKQQGEPVDQRRNAALERGQRERGQRRPAPAGPASGRGRPAAWSRWRPGRHREPQRAAATWRLASCRRQRHRVQAASGQAGQVNHSSRRPRLRHSRRQRLSGRTTRQCHRSSHARQAAGQQRQPRTCQQRPAPCCAGCASRRRSGSAQASSALPAPSSTAIVGAPLSARPARPTPRPMAGRRPWRYGRPRPWRKRSVR